MSMQRLPYAADCVRRHIVRPAQISHGLTLGLSLPDTTALGPFAAFSRPGFYTPIMTAFL